MQPRTPKASKGLRPDLKTLTTNHSLLPAAYCLLKSSRFSSLKYRMDSLPLSPSATGSRMTHSTTNHSLLPTVYCLLKSTRLSSLKYRMDSLSLSPSATGSRMTHSTTNHKPLPTAYYSYAQSAATSKGHSPDLTPHLLYFTHGIHRNGA